MSAHSRIDWLTLLRQEVGGSAWFWAELERQALQHARDLASVDLANGLFALLPGDEGFAVRFTEERDPDGSPRAVGSIDGVLVGPDAEGHPAALAWSTIERPGRRIDPEAASAQTPLQFFWQEFPSDAFKRFAAPPIQAGRGPADGAFEVEWGHHGWPDVWVELTPSTTFSATDAVQIGAALDRAIVDWNDGHEGKIHYRGPAEVTKDYPNLSMHVDFGAADRAALESLVRALGRSEAANSIARLITADGPLR